MKKYFLFGLILIALFIYQCSSIPDTRYYMIDYPIEMSAENVNPKYEIKLGVPKVSVDPVYNDGRLVYRDSHYEAKFYHYHRWVTDPGRMITDKLIEQLNSSAFFKQVVSYPMFTEVDYVLKVEVKELEEWDETGQWFANVKLHAQLVAKENVRRIIWYKTFEKRNPVQNKTPLDVVKGLNVGIKQCIDEVKMELDQFFSGMETE